MILMGLGNFVHGQKIKGLLYLAVEVAYIVFMAVNGITFLSMLGGLGSVPQKEVWDEASQVYLYTKGDQSILILLYGVATILVSVMMVFTWRGALRSAYKAECFAKEGKHVNTFGEDLKSLLHENLHRLLMTPPMIPSTAPASTLRAFAYASLYNTKIPPITSIVLTIAPVTPA
mgnify:FL=1